jgi:hypothetical protein
MIPTNVIKFVFYLFFIFSLSKAFSQEIKKEKLYFLLNNYENNCQYDFLKNKFKVLKPEGTQFNLCGEAIFINTIKDKKDTLCLFHLKDFKLTDAKDIEKRATIWREKNKEKLKKKYGMLYRQGSQYKNNVFEVFIIEKINSKQMVIYEVIFRNEGAIK